MSEIIELQPFAFLPGSKSIVFMSDSSEMVGDSSTPTKAITHGKGTTKKEIKFVQRGATNTLPIEVMEKVNDNVTVGSNVDFNARMAYGDGLMVVRKQQNKKGKIELVPVLDTEQPDIFEFLLNNNYVNSIQEWANDICVFADSFVEIIFGRGNDKIVSIRPVESVNSRISVADEKTGEIEYHGYSTKWHENVSDENVTITRLINRRCPISDLKEKRGLKMNLKGETKKEKDERYVLQLMLPTPGRYYYGKPYWWSIFTSRWYDFSCAIPRYKDALLKNQMVLKYHVKINERFWVRLFKAEGITHDLAKQKARRKKFLKDLDEFLSGEENAGKSFVSPFEYNIQKGVEEQDIIITPIESFFKGGEYIDDSEEVTNIICYAMGVHPSLVGASPGKGKSINGTEARELFIIKQALMKPIRDLLLLPLYIAKEINGWDKDIHFVIPNIMLTTLDKNTGATKSIGNQEV